MCFMLFHIFSYVMTKIGVVGRERERERERRNVVKIYYQFPISILHLRLSLAIGKIKNEI